MLHLYLIACQIASNILVPSLKEEEKKVFVSQKFKVKLKSSSGHSDENDKEESNEPDYDEDEDQLEESKKISCRNSDYNN